MISSCCGTLRWLGKINYILGAGSKSQKKGTGKAYQTPPGQEFPMLTPQMFGASSLSAWTRCRIVNLLKTALRMKTHFKISQLCTTHYEFAWALHISVFFFVFVCFCFCFVFFCRKKCDEKRKSLMMRGKHPPYHSNICSEAACALLRQGNFPRLTHKIPRRKTFSVVSCAQIRLAGVRVSRKRNQLVSMNHYRHSGFCCASFLFGFSFRHESCIERTVLCSKNRTRTFACRTNFLDLSQGAPDRKLEAWPKGAQPFLCTTELQWRV